ncbi:hypothetical protein R6Q59_032801 [Mikania micrantha]
MGLRIKVAKAPHQDKKPAHHQPDTQPPKTVLKTMGPLSREASQRWRRSPTTIRKYGNEKLNEIIKELVKEKEEEKERLNGIIAELEAEKEKHKMKKDAMSNRILLCLVIWYWNGMMIITGGFSIKNDVDTGLANIGGYWWENGSKKNGGKMVATNMVGKW